MSPYWITARKQKHNTAQQFINHTLDTNFPFLVEKVKALLAKDNPLVYERNYRKDPNGSLVALHAFLAPTVYLNLDCDGAYRYQMQYSFGNCPHEQEIRALIRSFRLHEIAKEEKRELNFATFYKNVLAYQGQSAFYTLYN